MKINELKRYVESLKSADPKNDEQFKNLLKTGMELLRLLDSDISREFGVSIPTVNRWRNGANAPHPAMRKPLFSYLEKRTSSLITREGNSHKGMIMTKNIVEKAFACVPAMHTPETYILHPEKLKLLFWANDYLAWADLPWYKRLLKRSPKEDDIKYEQLVEKVRKNQPNPSPTWSHWSKQK